MLAVQAERRRGHHDRGPRRGRRHAASDAGDVPRASRAAVRLLHAGHGDERDRPGEPASGGPDRGRRSAHGLEGNLCRCTGYHNIVKAIAAAWPLMHGKRSQAAANKRTREIRAGRQRMGFEGIGASVRRKEDHRFLSGRGNYTDDINRPGQLHAVIRRSDRPHARLLRHRHRGGEGRARRGRGLSPAPTSRPTASAACPAAGRSTTRTARRWRSRSIRCSRSARSATSATRSPW